MTIVNDKLLSNMQQDLLDVNTFYVDRGMKYGWVSNISKKHYDFGHWNNLILKDNRMFLFDHGKMPYINYHPELARIWNRIQELLPGRALVRAYVNGYTYGTDAYYHQDDNWLNKKYGADILSDTVIVYLNKEWDKDWGGETSIVKNEEIELAVLPKFGRCLILDSSKLHSARPLSRACPVLRSVLVFKTFDAKYNDPRIEALIENNFDKLKHSGKTFFEHLYNTSFILSKQGCVEDICAAGLYHSAYGTEHYESACNLNLTREKVKELIGEESENLVYLFCTLKSRTSAIIDNTYHLDNETIHKLRWIEYANLTDQNTNGKYNGALIALKQKLKSLSRVSK